MINHSKSDSSYRRGVVFAPYQGALNHASPTNGILSSDGILFMSL
jgi:hypothetical protein